MESAAVVDAVLLTEIPVQLRDISATGAQLETSIYFPIGTIGRIEVEFDGACRVEWFRVCRIHTTQGCSGAHIAAAEFLPIAAADDRSLRGAVRRFLARAAHLLIP
jgi:hypothetical protein